MLYWKRVLERQDGAVMNVSGLVGPASNNNYKHRSKLMAMGQLAVYINIFSCLHQLTYCLL